MRRFLAVGGAAIANSLSDSEALSSRRQWGEEREGGGGLGLPRVCDEQEAAYTAPKIDQWTRSIHSKRVGQAKHASLFVCFFACVLNKHTCKNARLLVYGRKDVRTQFSINPYKPASLRLRLATLGWLAQTCSIGPGNARQRRIDFDPHR